MAYTLFPDGRISADTVEEFELLMSRLEAEARREKRQRKIESKRAASEPVVAAPAPEPPQSLTPDTPAQPGN